MIKFVKELVDGSPTEWLHGHCYINFNALVAKAKNSDQYKVVTPADIQQLTDGRYVVVSEEGVAILSATGLQPRIISVLLQSVVGRFTAKAISSSPRRSPQPWGLVLCPSSVSGKPSRSVTVVVPKRS